jgi:hypothetical protein
LISKNKQKLRDYALNSGDFTRTRKLPIEHTIGIVMHMTANRNTDGYSISSQNYSAELSQFVGEPVEAATHQAISKAREKLDWEAFRYLLKEANQDVELHATRFRYRGHITRAVDGTQLTLPHSEELLEIFEQRKSMAGLGHYPGALMVTAINVFTGQCKAARVVNHTCSERDQLRSMIELDFERGDLTLLDRGFGGDQMFLCFDDHEQYYLCRMRSSGDHIAFYLQEFIASREKQQVVRQKVLRPDTGEEVEIRIRLIRGPKDNEGKRIILATNFSESSKYSRRSLLNLYRHRWTVETMYGRVKNLLKLEAFHSKSVNGVMQEIYANLLVISLTALIALGAAAALKLDAAVAVPSFKNAQAVVRRHLFDAILAHPEPTQKTSRALAKRLIDEASRVIWKKQPGRSYPRVSLQPIKFWPLAKNKKLKEFKNAQSKA